MSPVGHCAKFLWPQDKGSMVSCFEKESFLLLEPSILDCRYLQKWRIILAKLHV